MLQVSLFTYNFFDLGLVQGIVHNVRLGDLVLQDFAVAKGISHVATLSVDIVMAFLGHVS